MHAPRGGADLRRERPGPRFPPAARVSPHTFFPKCFLLARKYTAGCQSEKAPGLSALSHGWPPRSFRLVNTRFVEVVVPSQPYLVPSGLPRDPFPFTPNVLHRAPAPLTDNNFLTVSFSFLRTFPTSKSCSFSVWNVKQRFGALRLFRFPGDDLHRLAA